MSLEVRTTLTRFCKLDREFLDSENSKNVITVLRFEFS